MEYITLSEAASRWNISWERLLRLLELGMIRGVKVNDHSVLLPAHRTIKIPKEKQELTVDYISKCILETCDKMGYVDNRLLQIKEDEFAKIITSLESDGLLERTSKNGPLYSNESYMITSKGLEVAKKSRFSLNNITLSLSVNFFTISASIERGK